MTRGVFFLVTGLGLALFAQSSLPARLHAWARPLAPVSSPPPDPVVHCVAGESGIFVRRSRCVELRGEVREPAWSSAR